MDLKPVTVDDILDELHIIKAKATNLPLGDMQAVDEMIKDILVKRQKKQIQEQKRFISLQERQAMDQEIMEQTKSLTLEFEKMKKSANTTRNSATKTEPKEPNTNPATEKKVAHFQEHPKAKRRQDKKIVEETTSKVKTNITHENYQAFKVNRNKKIDEFVVEHKEEEIRPSDLLDVTKPTDVPKNIPSDPIHIKSPPPTPMNRDAEFQLEEVDEAYEYDDISQTQEVSDNLKSTSKIVKRGLISLSVLAIVSLALFFTTRSVESMMLVGNFELSPTIYAFSNMGILLIATIFSLSIFSNAISSIGEHKPDKDILYALMVIVSILANVVFCVVPARLLDHSIHLYTPLVVVVLWGNFLSKYLSIRKIIKNFKFVSSEGDKYALSAVSDMQIAYDMAKGAVDGEPIIVKNTKVDFLQNFLANSFKADLSDIIASKIALFAIPIAIVTAGIAYFLTKDLFLVVSISSATMIMLTSMIGALIVTLPLHDTAGVMSYFSGMLLEYSAVDTYKNTDAILIDANDLFSEETVVLHGIKTFQGKRIDDAIVDAASALSAGNSILQSVFMTIINHNTQLLKPVDSIIYEDLMGISAWVAERRVLIGNRALMVNHSIAVPNADYETKYQKDGKEVVFLSCGGELCAAFVIQFSAGKQSAEIANLLSQNDLVAIVKTVDACITSEMLAGVFGMDSALFKVLPSRLHRDFDAELQPQEKVDSILGNKGSLFGHMISIVACRKLAICTKLGGVMYIISAIFGVLLLVGMIILQKFTLIGNLQIFLFMASFLLIYWIYEKNIKI